MLLHWGCTWLTLMPLLLSLSTGELSYYRDALPSEDITLKQLAEYLKAETLNAEAQRFQQRFHRSHLSSLLSLVHKKHNLQHDDQKERNLLKILANKAELENLLMQQKLKTLVDHRQDQYNDLVDQIIPEREYVLPYYDLKLTYPDDKPNEDDQDNKDVGYERDLSFDVMASDGGMIEEPINFHMKYMQNHGTSHTGDAREAMQSVNIPEFTYKFNKMNFEEKQPFAVKPNDPRYYNDMPFSSEPQDTPEVTKEKVVEEQPMVKHVDNMQAFNQKVPKDLITIEPLKSEKTAEYHPLIVPIEHDLNNDIYFIAIVAGCSAAAMFALVLISLTWCRLQRGAKAAADIEYPAYGVTGPNKDVSPSGDQRLAQSAQMYHFQHQKQQIIMENRASATRDPGSLSEAESDEENEEGDYTVYECPGLASTGEMEVKNPMFHDDPTPATPAQSNNKEEDHI